MGCVSSDNVDNSPELIAALNLPAVQDGELLFGYWGVKGFGETSRWVLAFLKIKHQEWNPSSYDEWIKAKAAGLGSFPNLPFIRDDNFFLTESAAVVQYLVTKSGRVELLGKGFKDMSVVRQIQGVLGDLRKDFMTAVQSPSNQAAVLSKSLAADGSITQKISKLGAFLGSKEYFLSYLTIADIEFTYYSEIFAAIAVSLGLENPFTKSEKLKLLIDRVKSLQGIKERVAATKQVPFLPAPMVPFQLLTSAQIEASKK